MEEKIVLIINEMADYLNVSQMKKLQEVLLQTFSENTAPKEETSNIEYLQLFRREKDRRVLRTDNPVLLFYGGETAPEYRTASTKNHYRRNQKISCRLSENQ